MTYRSGFVGIVGRPNVGKSTLINALTGEKVAITSPKPQTTRHRLLGVRHMDGGQLVFLDTPGYHKAKGGLNRYMVDTALATLEDADVVFFMLEVSEKFISKTDIGEGNKLLLERIKEKAKPTILVLNKVDKVRKETLLPYIEKLNQIFDFDHIMPISALNQDGVEELANLAFKYMPEGPPYFDDLSYTDRTLRFLTEEIIREKIFHTMEQELPYCIAVQVDQFVEPKHEKARFEIYATIHVERDSQKGMVIGKGGSRIKEIGTLAREEISTMLDRRVYLELRAKVTKNWTSDGKLLEQLGYK